MATRPLPDEVLIETLRIYEAFGGHQMNAADSINVPKSTFQSRLHEANKRFPNGIPDTYKHYHTWSYPKMIRIDAPDTVWIIGSDLHIWTGEPPLIYQAFVKLAKKLKVDGIVMNGDVIDGARVSRHGSIMGSKAPKVDKEIETALKWFKMLPKAQYKMWTVGNHDIRVDNYLISQASELDDYVGSMRNKFPEWKFSYAVNINGTEVRHRFRSGIHAAYNNSLHSGVNLISGHTHQLQLTAVRDRNGTRWGVELGMMNDPFGPQFEYTEGQPSRWQQGFVVITFDETGEMLPPEICEMVRGRPVFRGEYVF
jgi:UDP-2,3-diacylglucosamine pyrophosphatase LpxH